MKNILVIGSMNMDYTIYCDDFPKDGETIYGESRFIQPGGKGANQAAAIAKSGLVNTRFISARGEDNDGVVIEDTLSKLGVDCHIKKSKYVTGNATIVVNKESENKIIIIGGANLDVLPNNDIDESIAWADYIVLQNEIPSDTNAYVMKKGHELGKVIIYNPAPYRELEPNLFQYIDFFTPNKGELAKYSKEEDISKCINKMLSFGVKNIIVTLGTKGSRFINKDEDFIVDAFKVNAVDTVAAGDTFVGYFTCALATGKSIKEAMTIASKASSITVSRKGSIVSIPNGNEVFY